MHLPKTWIYKSTLTLPFKAFLLIKKSFSIRDYIFFLLFTAKFLLSNRTTNYVERHSEASPSCAPPTSVFTEYCIRSNISEGSQVRTLCGHDQTPRSDSKIHSTDNGPQIQEQLAGRAAEREIITYIVTHCSPSFPPKWWSRKKIQEVRGSGGQSGVGVGVKTRVYNLYTSYWSDRVKIDRKTPRCQDTFVPLSSTWDRGKGWEWFQEESEPFFYQPESTSAFSHWLNVRVSLFINN